MTLSIYNPMPPSKAGTSEPADDVVKEESRRQQMLRDLEQFLSLPAQQRQVNFVAAGRRSRYGGKVVAGGAVQAE